MHLFLTEHDAEIIQQITGIVERYKEEEDEDGDEEPEEEEAIALLP